MTDTSLEERSRFLNGFMDEEEGSEAEYVDQNAGDQAEIYLNVVTGWLGFLQPKLLEGEVGTKAIRLQRLLKSYLEHGNQQ